MEPYTNHLIHEKSPYLKQHAHNPVNWYPWGSQAFNKALETNQLIFLSIGYATCHWCHVMERESFANLEVAQVLNQHFVSIKVDREELPEVDNFYIEAAAVLNEGGVGWPLNIILTPDLKPIYAVTYLPPETKGQNVGLKDLCLTLASLWRGAEQSELLQNADKVLTFMQTMHRTEGDEMPSEELVSHVIDALLEESDPLFGGHKGAPKFPLAYQLSFILTAYKLRGEARALFYVEKTLQNMAQGGIRDHLDGGFSRYTIDERWFFPHFEKLLYDNASLAEVYSEAWQVTKNDLYREISLEICDYVLKRLIAPTGGFFSGEDADSEGVEGKFYTWTLDEIERLLPEKEAALLALYYNISREGNFEGRNVLVQTLSLEDFSARMKIPVEEISLSLAQSRKILSEVRSQRERPLRDDKILAGWNGLMIHTLARISQIFDRPDYLMAAKNAAQFILETLYIAPFLKRRYCDGEVRFEAALEDYAFFIRALITLFEVDGNPNFLDQAVELSQTLKTYFRAPEGGYFESLEQEKIFIRRKEIYDDAMPSSQGVHAQNLIRLYQLTGNVDYLDDFISLLKASQSALNEYPIGGISLLQAYQRMLDPKATLAVLALNAERSSEKELRDLIYKSYHPHLSFIINGDELTKRVASLEDKKSIQNQTTLYLCTQRGCLKPLTVLKEIEEQLHKL